MGFSQVGDIRCRIRSTAENKMVAAALSDNTDVRRLPPGAALAAAGHMEPPPRAAAEFTSKIAGGYRRLLTMGSTRACIGVQFGRMVVVEQSRHGLADSALNNETSPGRDTNAGDPPGIYCGRQFICFNLSEYGTEYGTERMLAEWDRRLAGCR